MIKLKKKVMDRVSTPSLRMNCVKGNKDTIFFASPPATKRKVIEISIFFVNKKGKYFPYIVQMKTRKVADLFMSFCKLYCFFSISITLPVPLSRWPQRQEAMDYST